MFRMIVVNFSGETSDVIFWNLKIILLFNTFYFYDLK